MTSEEVARALRVCARTYEHPDCDKCYLYKHCTGVECIERLKREAADLIERLEKEKAALIDAANPKKLCKICKNDSYCFDARCDGNRCDDCWQYSDCPCADCLSHPKFEWKGLDGE